MACCEVGEVCSIDDCRLAGVTGRLIGVDDRLDDALDEPKFTERRLVGLGESKDDVGNSSFLSMLYGPRGRLAMYSAASSIESISKNLVRALFLCAFSNDG